MKINEERILKKDFIDNSTEITLIRSKIESWLPEINLSNKFHFKNFDTSQLRIRKSSSNYVIDEHEKNDPKFASSVANWNEEHWTKVVDLMHREKFKNCFWDSEVPIADYGKVDLILANNVSGNYFSKITIIELKSSKVARSGLKHALYYAHLLKLILNNVIPNLEINIVLLTFPEAEVKLSKEMLDRLKEDSKDIRNEYKGIISDIKIIEMEVHSPPPALKPQDEVIIPSNIKFVYHREVNDSPLTSSSLEEFL